MFSSLRLVRLTTRLYKSIIIRRCIPKKTVGFLTYSYVNSLAQACTTYASRTACDPLDDVKKCYKSYKIVNRAIVGVTISCLLQKFVLICKNTIAESKTVLIWKKRTFFELCV